MGKLISRVTKQNLCLFQLDKKIPRSKHFKSEVVILWVEDTSGHFLFVKNFLSFQTNFKRNWENY